MDSVRFGRALGFGARSAAKALAGAAAAATDAATAPSPGQPRSTAKAPRSTAGPVIPAVRAAARASVQGTARAGAARNGIARGSKRFGEAVWGPVAKLSGVLWLEITGSFFGIFALFAASAVWTHRADLHPTPANPDARQHLFVFLAMALVFGYFCISSFVRAYKR